MVLIERYLAVLITGQSIQKSRSVNMLVLIAEGTYKLKAQLRIAETQAKDIDVGQKAVIDTRNGLIDGRVIRIDPSVREGTVTVDVALVGDSVGTNVLGKIV